MESILASADNYGLWITGVVGGLTALGVAVRALVRTVRRIRKFANDVDEKVTALNDLAQYELRHNGGGSIKDHAALVPELADRVGKLEETFGTHLVESTKTTGEMWAAIRVVAESSPPEEVVASDQRD